MTAFAAIPQNLQVVLEHAAVTSTPHLPLTELLGAWRSGDGHAFAAVIEASHGQLQAIAKERMRQGGPMTLVPQEILNEAIARLLVAPPDLKNRGHFFATMSLLMRSIIVDHARARVAEKRGGKADRVTFRDTMGGEDQDVFDVLALDQAMLRLAQADRRGSEILHLTYFAGLPQDAIAELLGISLRTVERDLRFARAWLETAMRGPDHAL